MYFIARAEKDLTEYERDNNGFKRQKTKDILERLKNALESAKKSNDDFELFTEYSAALDDLREYGSGEELQKVLFLTISHIKSGNIEVSSSKILDRLNPENKSKVERKDSSYDYGFTSKAFEDYKTTLEQKSVLSYKYSEAKRTLGGAFLQIINQLKADGFQLELSKSDPTSMMICIYPTNGELLQSSQFEIFARELKSHCGDFGIEEFKKDYQPYTSLIDIKVSSKDKLDTLLNGLINRGFLLKSKNEASQKIALTNSNN